MKTSVTIPVNEEGQTTDSKVISWDHSSTVIIYENNVVRISLVGSSHNPTLYNKTASPMIVSAIGLHASSAKYLGYTTVNSSSSQILTSALGASPAELTIMVMQDTYRLVCRLLYTGGSSTTTVTSSCWRDVKITNTAT